MKRSSLTYYFTRDHLSAGGSFIGPEHKDFPFKKYDYVPLMSRSRSAKLFYHIQRKEFPKELRTTTP